mmetsp:Transcript_21403/g.30644  ORF Transcript_21403/g.30644 Transcript_21403/m.30644 type:complete len:197 (-) Transcript_21403:267-857(-)
MSDNSENAEGQPIPAEGVEDNLPQWIAGMAQGMAISPAAYILMDTYLAELDAASRAYHDSGDLQYLEQYHGELDDGEYAYDHSTLGEEQVEPTADSTHSSPSASIASHTESYITRYEYYNQDQSGGYYADAYEGNMTSAANGNRNSIDFEGDTAASTASYMSEVEVIRMGQGVPQVEGFLVEIPVRELDDPPDGSV